MRRLALGAASFVLAAVVLGACSADDGPAESSTTSTVETNAGDAPTEAALAVLEPMGCDETREVEMNWLAPYRLEQTLDCYRDTRFQGRVHVFEGSVSQQNIYSAGWWRGGLRPGLTEAELQECPWTQRYVVIGDGWAVMTPSAYTAERVVQAVGGFMPDEEILGPPPSYPTLPCVE